MTFFGYQVDSELVLLATTLAGFTAQAWREHRNRKWAYQDRRAEAASATLARESAVSVATAERKAATEEIVMRAQAEAEVTRIKTAAIADNMRVEAAAIAERLRVAGLETAERLHRDTQEVAKVIRDNSIAQAAVIRAEHKEGVATLTARIEETKTEATNAFKEANHVNLKIEDLNKRLLEASHVNAIVGQPTPSEVAAKTLHCVEDIQAHGSKVTQEVLAIVKDDLAGIKDLQAHGSKGPGKGQP